jgi:DsbE subfamily thiol:disulfide oxidoreductase
VQKGDGGSVDLASYRGKVVLVDFWASWCPPCKTSFPALDALYREYAAKGVEVLAVNLDERRRDADAFLSAHPHRMTVLFDPKGAAPVAFGVKGMPSSYILDRNGNIRFTHMGYSGNVDESYRRELVQLLAEH